MFPRRSRPLETKARRGVPWLLGLHAVASAVEVLVAAYGSLLLAFHVELCSHWGSRPLAVALVWTSWGLIAFNALLTAVLYNPWHGLDLVEAWESGFMALFRLVRQQSLLTRGAAHDRDSALKRIAEFWASLFQHVDLTLSDIATAMLLVNVAQDLRRKKVLREAMVAAAQAAGQPISRQTTGEALADEAAPQLAQPPNVAAQEVATGPPPAPLRPLRVAVLGASAAAADKSTTRAASSAGGVCQSPLPPSVTILHRPLHLTPVGIEDHIDELTNELAGTLAEPREAAEKPQAAGDSGVGNSQPQPAVASPLGAIRRQGGEASRRAREASFGADPLARSGLQRVRFADEHAAMQPASATAAPSQSAFLDAALSQAPVPQAAAEPSPAAAQADAAGAVAAEVAEATGDSFGGEQLLPGAAAGATTGAGADGLSPVGTVKRAAAAIEAALAAGVTRSGSWSAAEAAALTAAGAPAVGSAAAATGHHSDGDGDGDDPFSAFLPMPPKSTSPSEVTTEGFESPVGELRAKGQAPELTRSVRVVARAGALVEGAEELQDPAAEAAAGASGSEGGAVPAAQVVGAPPGLTEAAGVASLGGREGSGASQQVPLEHVPCPFQAFQKPRTPLSPHPPRPFALAQASCVSSTDYVPPLLQPTGSGESLFASDATPDLGNTPTAAAVLGDEAAPTHTDNPLYDVGRPRLPPAVTIIHRPLHLTPVGMEDHIEELAKELPAEVLAEEETAPAPADAEGAEPEAPDGAAPGSETAARTASLNSKVARDVAATELRQRIADAAMAAAFATAERATVDRSTLEEARVYCRYAAAMYANFDARTDSEYAMWQVRYAARMAVGWMSAEDAMRAAIRECLERLTPYVIHINTENGAEGYLPYAVCLDEATRTVVISVRGTASLEDVVTDCLLAPYDVRDLLPPGLLPARTSGGGGGGAAEDEEEEPVLVHGGIWGAAEAVLVDLKRLGLLELLFPAPPGGAAASSSSAAPAASADSSAAAALGKGASNAQAGAAAAQASVSTGGGASVSPERNVPACPSVSGPSRGTGDRPPSLHRTRRSRWQTLGAEPPKLLSAERSVSSGGLLSNTSSRIVGDAGAKGWRALRSNMSRLVSASQTAGSSVKAGGGWNLLLSQMSRLRAAAAGTSQTASASGAAGGSVTGRSSSWTGLMTRLQSFRATSAEAQGGGVSREGNASSVRSSSWNALFSQLSRLQTAMSSGSQSAPHGSDDGTTSARNSAWSSRPSPTSRLQSVREEGPDSGDNSGSSESRAGAGRSGGWRTLRSQLTRLAPFEAATGSRTGSGGWRALLTQLPQLVAAQLTEAGSRLLGTSTGNDEGTSDADKAGRALAKNRSYMAIRRATDKTLKVSAAETVAADAKTESGGAPSAIKRLMITLPLPLPTRDGPAGASGGGARPWRVVVTGHSLGGGAAALLAMRLRAALPHVEVKAIVFAPPGALASPELCAAMEPFCVSVVGGTDLVPRMSPQTMERYRDEMMTALARCSCSKAEVLIGSLTKTSRARRAARLLLPYEEIPPEAAETLWRYHQATQEVERLPDLHAPGKILYLQPSAVPTFQRAMPPTPGRADSGDLGLGSPTTARRLAKQTSSILRRVPFFYGAGAGGGAASSPKAAEPAIRYRPVWVSAKELNAEGILASARMIQDHFLPVSTLPALEQLLKPEPPKA
ncbi:hypothetical protein HYH03_002356 [Edaphochlamys debaryana]|uniref:sn-1-specific diacylglycerol lipase n=1 Tax=Edaphochlamys debaryana TaxID=47281 RepID=A0A836C5P8_9CHLO|nr:hypothetical protein HYH03_002356 [Edaphochlamys debaryana]|eukprot:KAG2500079.1 hypothetical protein HYH03_002356 [Edaphochlamys debaryana]